MPPWTGSRRKIARGNTGSTETVNAMTQLAYEGSIDPVVIKAAQDAIRLVPERNDYATFQAVLDDVRRRMRYTADPIDAEVVKHPRVAIQGSDDSPNGREPMDCDDVSTLTAAMLGALGYQTRFATVAADASRPKEWSHVYLVARTTAGAWVPMDPIMRGWPIGKEVPEAHLTAPRVYHGGNMRGIGVDPFSAAQNAAFAANYTALTTASEAQRAALMAKPAPAETSWWRQGLDYVGKEGPSLAKAYLESRRKPAPVINKTVIRGPQGGSSPGFFSNPDGSTNWTNVAIVGGGAAVVLFLVMRKR